MTFPYLPKDPSEYWLARYREVSLQCSELIKENLALRELVKDMIASLKTGHAMTEAILKKLG
jgi:hypothetical protein